MDIATMEMQGLQKGMMFFSREGLHRVESRPEIFRHEDGQHQVDLIATNMGTLRSKRFAGHPKRIFYCLVPTLDEALEIIRQTFGDDAVSVLRRRPS